MMNRLQILFQLSLADVRERTRRYSFLITMLGVMFFGYLVITGKYTVQFGEFKSVYNSAWAGSVMAVCSAIMITLVGFYLIRGSIKRDRTTEVGQIIAATRISNSLYITSKLLGNIAALGLMVISLAALAFITLLFKNEASGIDLWAFASPFVIICLPATIFVASVALLFENVRWLRGSVGNIIYLFLAESWVVFGMLAVPFLDLASVAVFTDSARAAARAAFPGESVGLLMGFVEFDKAMRVSAFRTFPWTGIDWTFPMLLFRLYWIAAASSVTGLAALCFDRFDPARVAQKRTELKADRVAVKDSPGRQFTGSASSYGSLCPVQTGFSPIRMVVAEFRLALKGYHWFWYAVALGLLAGLIATPFDIARRFLVPAAMIWPLVIWSSLGTRESRHGTVDLLFSSSRPLRRQFPAIWLSGVLVAAVSLCPMILRAGVAGMWGYLATLTVAAVLVPTVALALGTLSGSKKLFEVTYLMIWYIGSIDGLAALDLLGTTHQSVSISKLSTLISIAIGALAVAFAARWWRIRSR